jgi:Helix-turn-helix domain
MSAPLREVLAALVLDPESAATLAPELRGPLVIELASLQSRVAAGMVTAQPVQASAERQEAGSAPRLLTVAEAAERARKSPRWVRENWRAEMPFAIRKGRTVLFPAAEFDRWLKRP